MRANNFYAQLWVEKCSEAGDLIDLAIKNSELLVYNFTEQKASRMALESFTQCNERDKLNSDSSSSVNVGEAVNADCFRRARAVSMEEK